MQNLTSDTNQLSAGELRNEIAEVVRDSHGWLMTPHELLGGKKPDDLLNSNSTEDRRRLQDLVESIKHGLFS